MPNYLLRKDTGELEFVTGSEPFTVTPSNGTGTYDVYRLDNSAAVTVTGSDTDAPSIENLQALVSSQNEATLTWSTDEANGTAYWVCTTSVTVPSPAQIKTGQNHQGTTAEASGAQLVDVVGAQSTQPVDGLQDGQSYSFHLMHEDTSGNTSPTLTANVTVPDVDTSVPMLSGLVASASGTTATLSYATNKDNGGIYWVLTNSAQKPASWRIRRGQDHTGADAAATGYQLVTSAGAQQDGVATDLEAGSTYYFHLYHRDSVGTSAVASATVVIEDVTPVDTTAPSLSNVSSSIAGNTATLRWSSDEDNGMGYWVCTTSVVAPTAAQIIAGQDHTGSTAFDSGIETVSSTGAQPVQTVSGLSAGPSYFFHLLQRDAAGNTSVRVSTNGVSVAVTGGASAEINIVRRSALQVAPEGIFFEVDLNGFDTPGPEGDAIYDPQYHNLYYYWNFGENYTYTATSQSQLKDSEAGYGPLGAHTYRTPGTYRVSCLVVEPSSGKSAVAELDITIGNPDSAFTANDQTIVVDTTGAGLPEYPNAIVETTLDAAISRVRNYNDEFTPRRVVLRRGQAFSSGGVNFRGRSNRRHPSMHFIAGGTGSKPMVQLSGQIGWNDLETATDGNEKDFTWQGIEVVGAWDPRTETGAAFDGFSIQINPPRQFVLDQCVVRNFQSNLISGGQDQSNGGRYTTFINDTLITAWGNYGFLNGLSRETIITGSSISQDPLANAGGRKTVPITKNNHGPIRIARPGKVIIHSSEMYSRCNWFASENVWGQQPNIRFDTDGIGGGRLNVQSCAFEGGDNVLVFGTENQFTDRTVNALVEKSYLLASHSTRTCMAIAKSGVTIRNNIVTVPNTPEYSGYGIRRFFRMAWDGVVAENRDAPIRIHNNTLVNLGTRDLDTVEITGFSDALFDNNIVHKPNIGSPVTIDSPLASEVLFAPKEPGYKDGSTPLQTAYATPANTAQSFAPQVGSDALGDALSGPVAYDDFHGNIRPQYPSRGAFEA